ncbi:MAG: hypothetical protein MUC92_14045 [Fimbriimonadaceae bacterium]|nr:hypothetical protein [Fimbriimonadaceae bacterium]
MVTLKEVGLVETDVFILPYLFRHLAEGHSVLDAVRALHSAAQPAGELWHEVETFVNGLSDEQRKEVLGRDTQQLQESLALTVHFFSVFGAANATLPN